MGLPPRADGRRCYGVELNAMLFALLSVNAVKPAAPNEISCGPAEGVGSMYSAMVCVLRLYTPISFPAKFVNHSWFFPGGPAVIWIGCSFGDVVGNSWNCPNVLMLPSLLAASSVNHSFPSAPAAMPEGTLLAVGTGNSAMVMSLFTWPILLPLASVNHMVPSSPWVMKAGCACGVGTLISVIWPDGVMNPTLLLNISQNHTSPLPPNEE